MLRLLFLIPLVTVLGELNLNAMEESNTIDQTILTKIARHINQHNERISHAHSFILLMAATNDEQLVLPKPPSNLGPVSYASPNDWSDWINDKLPEEFDHKTVAVGHDFLAANELFAYVKESVDQDFPITFYMTEASKLGLVTVVGYRVEKSSVSYLVLPAHAYDGLIKIVTAKELLKSIDLASWLFELRGIVETLKVFPYESRIFPSARRFLAQTKRYSIVHFVPKTPQLILETTSPPTTNWLVERLYYLLKFM